MAEKAKKKEKRPRGARWLLLAGSLVVALLAAEGIVRVLGVAPVINRINPDMKKTVYRVSENPVLGYVFKENYRDTGSPDLKASYPYINAHGFRDVEREYEKPPGVKRVILLGDSLVAGAVNIPDIDDIVGRQLEKLVAGRNVEVISMGINGYCTRAELELLRERGLKYDPDLVILVFCHNDFHDINSDLGMVSQPAAVQWCFVHSHLFRVTAIRLNLFGLRTQFGLQEIEGEWAGELLTKGRDKAVDIVNSDRETSAAVKDHLFAVGDRNVHRSIPELKQLAEEHGFKVVVAIWPFFDKKGIGDVEAWNTDNLISVGLDGTLEIERLAREADIPYFRLSRYFLEDYSGKLDRGEVTEINPMAHYIGTGDREGNLHVNPEGARVAARAIADVLQRHPEFLK